MSNYVDWQSPAFRERVISSIDDALEEYENRTGSQKEENAEEIEDKIFQRSASGDTYMSLIARIILHLQQGGQNQQQSISNSNEEPLMPMIVNLGEMLSNTGDWQSPSFREKVISNIDDALKKYANRTGSQNEKSAEEIEEQIFQTSAARDNYTSAVARIILRLFQGQNHEQSE